MKKVSIYHNNRCSKSRQVLALLQEKNVNLDIVEYLKQPLLEGLDDIGQTMKQEEKIAAYELAHKMAPVSQA